MKNSARIEVKPEVHEVVAENLPTLGGLQRSRYVRIAVADTGRGKDKLTLARIFEPFFTTRPMGKGLGLATAHEIVREHGGAMKVESTPGGRSPLEVWLPCVATATAAVH